MPDADETPPEAVTLILIDRFPDDLLHRLAAAALRNGRDFDEELIDRLETSLERDDPRTVAPAKHAEAGEMSEAVRGRFVEAARDGVPPELLEALIRQDRP